MLVGQGKVSVCAIFNMSTSSEHPVKEQLQQPQQDATSTNANQMEDIINDNNNSKLSSNGTNKGDNDTKEPPNKKFRATEDIDLRFLISSKVLITI